MLDNKQPIRGKLPKRKDFYRDVNINQEPEKSRIKAAIFPKYWKRMSMFKEQIEKLAKASVGEKVYFGKYPCDKNGGKQPIQWRVLTKRENSLLLLTEYGIDEKSYHENDSDITWENCTLRRWLNGEFLNEAFSDFEKKLIRTTNVDNSRREGDSGYDTNGGNNTEDRVFLLSYREAFWIYLRNDNSRICFPTKYAESQGAYVNKKTGSTYWWLRSPASDQHSVTRVDTDGSRDEFVGVAPACIRPALWINLESGIF